MVTHIMAYASRAHFRESSDLAVMFPKARVNCVVTFRLKSMALITQSSDTGDLTTKTHSSYYIKMYITAPIRSNVGVKVNHSWRTGYPNPVHSML